MKNRRPQEEDTEAQYLLRELSNGKLKRSRHSGNLLRAAKDAANSYFKKQARINIRLSDIDLSRLKRRAVEEGLAYQTLIASVLHKFVTGKLVSRRDDD